MTPIAAAADRAETWLSKAALPLWAARGVDPDGAFYETLDFNGGANKGSVRRMRVQARQIYVFSEAALRGWLPGAEALSAKGLDRMMADCWAPDGRAGFIHTLTPDRAPLDARRDLYDHAFGLFSLAWRFKLDGDAHTLERALAVADFIANDMAHPSGEGMVESLPPALPRRSNPHMHMLEAYMAWAEISGDQRFFDRAGQMLELFRRHFYDRATTTYGEFFTDDWRIEPGPAGQSVEPGHHFEWTWLLSEARRLGIADLTHEAEALYDFGLAHGLDVQGFAVDEMDRQGRHLKPSRRAWCQNEHLKAHIAMARAGRPGAEQAAADAANAFLDSYLATDVPGLWMDQFGGDGRGVSDNVPASTLYHIQLAFRELIDYAAAGSIAT